MACNLPQWAQKQDATLLIFLTVLWYGAAFDYLRQPIYDKAGGLVLTLFALVGMPALSVTFAIEQRRKISRWIYITALIVGVSPCAAVLLYAWYYVHRL